MEGTRHVKDVSRKISGGAYTIGSSFPIQFRYDWNRKIISYYNRNDWHDWNINRDHFHADGEPLIPNTAEVAFVSAYNMRFLNDKSGYNSVLNRSYQVINESLCRALGI